MDIELQKELDFKWNIAQTVYEYNFSNYAVCDICRSYKNSHICRIFHNINGADFTRLIKRRDKTYISQISKHIIIGECCKNKILKGWFGCQCIYVKI